MEKSTDKQDSNSELIKRKDIKDTPFTIITTNEGSFGVMGKYRLTELKENKKDVEKELKKVTWNRITQVIMLILESREEFENNQN